MHKEVFEELKEMLIIGSQFHECAKLWCNEYGYRGMRRVHWYNQKHDYERACDLDEFILNQPYDFKTIYLDEYPKLEKFNLATYKEMLELYDSKEKQTIKKLKEYCSKLREANDFTGYCFVYKILEEVECEYNKLCITLKELNNYGWNPEVVYMKDKQIHDKMKDKM